MTVFIKQTLTLNFEGLVLSLNDKPMRVVAEFSQPDLKITIFSWNGKFLLKFERGMYEQTYKVSEMDLTGDDEIKKLVLDEEFLKNVRQRFQEMNSSLNMALNRI